MDPKTGIHEPVVTIPWWMDCREPYRLERIPGPALIWKFIFPIAANIKSGYAEISNESKK